MPRTRLKPKRRKPAIIMVYDCPLRGHLNNGALTVVNSMAPQFVGFRCAKCHCLVYEIRETSPIAGPSGEALPAATGPVGSEPCPVNPNCVSGPHEHPPGFTGRPIREPQPDDEETR